jgi:hypothetical protein
MRGTVSIFSNDNKKKTKIAQDGVGAWADCNYTFHHKQQKQKLQHREYIAVKQSNVPRKYGNILPKPRSSV